MPLLILFVLKSSLNASFIVWQVQGAKDESQNRAAASKIASIIQTDWGSKRSNYHDRFNLTAAGHPQPAKLKSTSSWSWLPANGRELINAVLKPRLRLFLLVGLYAPLLLSKFSAPRAGNGQKGFAGLVNTHGQGSSDKNCFNVLRNEGSRRRGRPSTGSGNIRAWREIAAGAGTWPDDKITEDPGREKGAGTGAGTRAGIRADIRAGIRVGIRAGTEWGNKGKKDLGQRDEGDPTGAQSFASRSFLLAAYLFFFFTTSFSEFVTTWPGLSTMAGLAVNSKSVTSVKRGDPSSRYPVAEMWKPRARRVLPARSSVLQPPKPKASVS